MTRVQSDMQDVLRYSQSVISASSHGKTTGAAQGGDTQARNNSMRLAASFHMAP